MQKIKKYRRVKRRPKPLHVRCWRAIKGRSKTLLWVLMGGTVGATALSVMATPKLPQFADLFPRETQQQLLSCQRIFLLHRGEGEADRLAPLSEKKQAGDCLVTYLVYGFKPIPEADNPMGEAQTYYLHTQPFTTTVEAQIVLYNLEQAHYQGQLVSLTDIEQVRDLEDARTITHPSFDYTHWANPGHHSQEQQSLLKSLRWINTLPPLEQSYSVVDYIGHKVSRSWKLQKREWIGMLQG